MKVIYLDADYRCHMDDGGGQYQPWEDASGFFEGKCNAFIEGFRAVPAGQTWTAPDGTKYAGEMIAPAVDMRVLEAAQSTYEELNRRVGELTQESTAAMLAITEVYELVLGGV